MRHRQAIDLSGELLKVEIALRRAQLKKTLWELPALENDEVPLAFGSFSINTWQQMKKFGLAPLPVRFGKRLLYRTDDLRKWLARQATPTVPASESRSRPRTPKA